MREVLFLNPKVTFAFVSGLLPLYAERGNWAMKKILVSAALGLMALLVFGQENRGQQTSGGGQSELNATTEAMGRGHNHEEHEHMGAHMHMSELRKAQPGDPAKAQQVVDQARPALEK